jgi:hypothetical protein
MLKKTTYTSKCMQGSEFVDTRLYISVRPFLEYEIPNVANTVFKAFTGDVTVVHAQKEIDRLRGTKLCNVDYVSPPGNLGDLNSHCMRVVNFVIEHVKQVEYEWISFLVRTSDGIQRESQSLRKHIHDVRQVYERYKTLKSRRIDREYDIEMNTLRTRFREMIETYRACQTPVVHRSEPMKRSSDELRECFANAYGKDDTVSLMRMRQHFQYEIASNQVDILNSFCTRCEEILHRR